MTLTFRLTSATPYTCADGSKASSVGTLRLFLSMDKSKATDQDSMVSYITDAIMEALQGEVIAE